MGQFNPTRKDWRGARPAAQHFRPPQAAGERLKLLCKRRQFQNFQVETDQRSRRPAPPGALYSPFLARWRVGGKKIQPANAKI